MRRILALAVAMAFSGCGPSSMKHYLRSARADISAMPELSMVNPESDETSNIFSLRSNHSNRGSARLTAENLMDTMNAVYGLPENYSVDWDPAGFGFGYRIVADRNIDFFLSFNTGFRNTFKNNSGVIGMGVNLPFRWANFRVSPALGLHSYGVSYTDSVVEHYQDSDFPDTSFVRSFSGRGSSFVGGVGMTLWPSDELTGKFLKPYFGFQYTGIAVNQDTRLFEEWGRWGLPVDIFDLGETVVRVGLHYNFSKKYFLNVSGSRRELGNSNSSAVYYRLESGLEVNMN